MLGLGLNLSKNRVLGSVLVPSLGSFVPLSWTGANVSKYVFDVASGTANTYNTIQRDSSGTAFTYNMFSVETFSSDNDFVISGDTYQDANTSFMVGFGLKSDTGTNFSDLDFAVWPNGTNINWIISGNDGIKTTITSGELFSYSLVYSTSANEVKLYINGVLIITSATSYSSDTLAVKIQGRTPNTKICDHLALKVIAQPNRIMLPLGDSITFGRADAGAAGGSYVYKTIANEAHRHFANPVLAIAGATTTTLISAQLPRASDYYDAGYTSNIATVMIGINDLQLSVALGTIQTNISTIVSGLQTDGFEVVIMTVLRDWGTDWSDRYLLNTWMVAGNSGADYVVDLRVLPSETADVNREVDKLHPDPQGMTEAADVLWLTMKDI